MPDFCVRLHVSILEILICMSAVKTLVFLELEHKYPFFKGLLRNVTLNPEPLLAPLNFSWKRSAANLTGEP